MQEEMYGTDLSASDINGNSMPDGWEVQYDLDPLSEILLGCG